MKRSLLSRSAQVALFLCLILGSSAASAPGGEAIPNWAAPPTWSPHSALRGVTTMADITSPLPFIGVTPCRQYDSRNATPLPQNTAREVVITGAPCGIPSGAAAVSLNVTVFDVLGQTGNAVFQVGTTNNPTTAWINYPIGQGQIGNAGVLPLTGAGSIFFRVQQGGGSIDFTIDVNGYYASTPAASGTTFYVINNTPWAITGRTTSSANLATGVLGQASALTGNTIGVWGETLSSGLFARGVMGFAQANSGFTFGVIGQSNSTAGTGVFGTAVATTGVTFGVWGISNSASNDSAGVYGKDASGSPVSETHSPAGVRGESKYYWGVLGIAGNLSLGAVAGVLHDTAGVEQSGGYLGYNSSTGIYYLNGLTGSGTKNFVEPHPTDASKVIRYVSIEGREAGTYFRGRGKFQRGFATIELPEDFRVVTDAERLSIQVTPIGDIAGVAVVRIGLDGIVVKASRDVEFFYTVNGVRRAYKDWDPVQPNEKFFVPESPNSKLPKYLSEDEQGRLIANGTYNPDGTVNLETAERLGWAKAWRDREEQAKADAAAYRASREARGE
jgi:hypothetical protein